MIERDVTIAAPITHVTSEAAITHATSEAAITHFTSEAAAKRPLSVPQRPLSAHSDPCRPLLQTTLRRLSFRF